MKSKMSDITEIELEQLDAFLDQHLETFEMTPEEWRFMQAAKKRGMKKLMLSMGFTGLLVYYFGFIKAFFVKIITSKMIVAVVTGTAVVTTAAVVAVKYIEIPETEELDKSKPEVINEHVNDKSDTTDISKKEDTDQRKKDTSVKPVYKPNVGIMRFEALGEQKALSKQITTEIIKNLPPQRFRLIKKAEDGKGYINTLVTGSVVKTGSKYIVSVKARDLNFTVILNKKYIFTDNREVKQVSKKIARELSNADF